jgi:hypothetical protein
MYHESYRPSGIVLARLGYTLEHACHMAMAVLIRLVSLACRLEPSSKWKQLLRSGPQATEALRRVEPDYLCGSGIVTARSGYRGSTCQ